MLLRNAYLASANRLREILGSRAMTASAGIAIAQGKLRVEVDGAPADIDGGLRHLETLLAHTSATARKLEAELPAALAARDAAALRHSRASQFPLSALMSGRPASLRPRLDAAEAKLQELAAQRNACTVALRFDIGETALDAFIRVAAAHVGLARAARIWEVPHGQVAAKMGVVPPRTPVTAKPFLPEFVVSRWPGLALQDRDGVGITVFPGFVMTRQAGAVGGTALADLLTVTVESGEVRLPEREALPPDATVVDYTWERVNRDGSPDRRYANNARIPIVAYGCLHITIGANDRRAFLVSNREAATSFAEAINLFQASLRAASPGSAKDEHDRDAWLASGPEPVVRVPPPPRASAAHELTAALAVAIGLAGWSLSGLHASPPQVAAPPPTASAPTEPSPTAVPPSGPPRAEPPQQPVQPAAEQVPMPTALQAEPIGPAPPPAPVQAEPVRPVPPPAPARREQVVTRTGANVRAGPNGTAEVVRTVPAAVRLLVFSRGTGGWVQIGDTVPWGWIHSSLLDAAE